MIKREIKIGVFVATALALLGWGLNYLKGRDIFFRGNIYYGVFSKVDGLNDASPIYYHGFKVGSVRDIVIDQTNGDRFIVTFALNRELKLPKNSVAQIYSLDLLGSKGVQFIQGNSSERIQPYDTLSTSVMADITDQLSTSVLPLKEKTERLISRFDTVLAQVGTLFDRKNVENLTHAIESFSSSMNHLEQLSANLSNYTGAGGQLPATTRKLDSLLDKLNSQGHYIDTTMHALSVVATDLRNSQIDQTILALKSTLQQTDSMMQSINHSDGSLGLLINDKALYHSLADASANLNRLLMDVRHNPKRYVSFSAFDFGKKVYFDATASKDEILFYIQLFSSKKTVPLEKNYITDRYHIVEFFDGRHYRYITAQSKLYQDVLKMHEQVKTLYPKSEIIAIENDRVIGVGQALKRINK